MKLLIVLCCAILKFSICNGGNQPEIKTYLEKSTDITNARASEQALAIKHIRGTGNGSRSSPRQSSSVHRSQKREDEGSVKAKEYVFLSEIEPEVRIIDANTYELIAHYEALPEVQYSIGAIINDTFYNIDFLNGNITKTYVGNLVSGKNPVPWTPVTTFQGSSWMVRNNGVAVNESTVYFLSFFGDLYSFDVKSAQVGVIGTTSSTYGESFPSLITVNGIVYIQRYTELFSYDGNEIKRINTPEVTARPGLLESEGKVCRFGGNLTERFPNPIDCYDQKTETWSTLAKVNDIRSDTGTATTQSGKVHFFGGYNSYQQPTLNGWVNSSIVYDPSSNNWNIISPNVFSSPPSFVQAITFFH